jgi:N-carbamoylputrescine amidase
MITIGLIQLRCRPDRDENLHQAQEMARQAAKLGARIICLPELFLHPYFPQTENSEHFALAEPIPGPTTHVMGQLAAELGVVVIASIFEKRTDGIYHNTCAVLNDDGTCLGTYRKMHIPDDPSYYEKFYFTPGDLGFRAFDTRYARVGPLICWDQWFPEAARLTALRGAQILVYPTAIGWHPAEKESVGQCQHDAWELVQRAHAVTNGCFVAAVNRVGYEPAPHGGIEFWGQTFACNPWGEILVRGTAHREEVLLAELDLAQIETFRTHWPFLRDRRIDAYAGLQQRYLDDNAP